jgi:hypothetical protein
MASMHRFFGNVFRHFDVGRLAFVEYVSPSILFTLAGLGLDLRHILLGTKYIPSVRFSLQHNLGHLRPGDHRATESLKYTVS